MTKMDKTTVGEGSKEKYHEVFVPFPDVYDMGGPEAFTEFERKTDVDEKRNLVILPMPFVDSMNNLIKKENSVGCADALKFLRKAKDNGGLIQPATEPNRWSIYRISDGLDVATTETSGSYKMDSDFDLSDLLKKAFDYFHVPQEKLSLISLNDMIHLKYGGRGINVQTPNFLIVDSDIVHRGVLLGNQELYAKLYESKGSLPIDKVLDISGWRELYMNQVVKFFTGSQSGLKEEFAILRGDLIRSSSGRIVRTENERLELLKREEYNLAKGKLRIGSHTIDNLLGVRPKDMEQYIAMQHFMMSNDVSLLFLCGKRGSGKTLLSYVSAIDSVLWYPEDVRQKRGYSSPSLKGGRFSQIIIMKAPEILGGKRRDPGFLPGSLYEKIKPHLQPFIDSHDETALRHIYFEELLRHPKYATSDFPIRTPEVTPGNGVYFNTGLPVINFVYSGFIGGGSKRNTLFLIDEAQDFTPYELKTILERLAEGSAAIVMGDTMQCRNPYCTPEINGLTSAIRNYIKKPYSALIYLHKNYRDQISEDTEDWKVYNKSG